MPFTQEEREQISSAIQAKAPQVNRCPICLNQDWSLQDGFAVPGIQDNISRIVIGGPVLPSVVIVCTNCGNTHFLNALILGLQDLVEKHRG